jgi:hemerythrin superfamily protein
MLDIMAEISALGISSNSGRKKLVQAKDVLMSHIINEDARYYPALRKAAGNNTDLKKMLDYFVKDMEFVSKEAVRLFDKYSEGGDEKVFASDFKMLYVTLKDRIRTEEETLFQKFKPVAD